MARSGLFCPNCALPGQRATSQETLQLARRMSTERLEQLIKADPASVVLDELKDHMLNLIEQHIEKKLQTRKMMAIEPEQLT